MSAVFCYSGTQKELAIDSYNRVSQNRKVYVEIMEIGTFYPAEDYHQKYFLQHNPELLREFRAYSTIQDFVESTAATRVNGYIAGCGSLAELQEEIDTYGLSAEAKELLLSMVQRRS
jgi:peptide-methionine (S)-S-oxide reductase